MNTPLSIDLHYHSFTLDHGLRVFVHEHAAAPVASVNIWYHVGSQNERPGRTGFAHLFEHLMFEGSAHVPPGQFDRLLEDVGGINNGSTSPDRTNYWITVPSHALELALYLEADRMGWLPPAISQEKLDNQRSVVMNERRESYENRPYGLAMERLLEALYPANHPYHWPTIGSMADLRAASLEDVLAFFDTFYVPGNATLAVAGAVKAKRVRELVEKHFSGVPPGRGAPPRAAPPPAVLDSERRLVLQDDVHLPRLYMAWHSPSAFAAGDAELDLAAHVLGYGKVSRLYRSLVYELQIAQDVRAVQRSAQLGSIFLVVATARPGTDLRQVESLVREEVASLAESGVHEEELSRAQSMAEAGFLDDLQSVGGFGGRADRLNLYAFHTGDPGYLPQDLRRYTGATHDAVQASVQALAGAECVVLDVVPRRTPKG